jgi:hypothetical protein
MWRASEPEAVDVVLGACRLGVNRRVMLAHLRCEQVGVVDTLSTRADFLTAHEHIIRVREEWVGGRRHGISRTDGEGELVKCVKVRVVLLKDQFTEQLFLWCAARLLGLVENE